MKNIGKKKWIIGIGGGIVVPLVPLMSTVSFAATPVHTLDFGLYINAINDRATDLINVDKWNASVKQKFVASNYYKDVIGKGNTLWHIGNNIDVNNHISALYDSSEFTDDEKVTIAKYIINNEAFADLLKNFGFITDSTLTYTTTEELDSVRGNLIDPSRLTSLELTYNGTPIAARGSTSINREWSSFNNPYEIELNVSNRTIANYFTALVGHSPVLPKLDAWIETEMAGIIAGTIDFATALDGLKNQVDVFLSHFATSKTSVSELLKLSTFDFLQGVDLNGSTDPNVVYEKVLRSNFGLALFGSNQIEERIASFKIITSDIQKKIRIVDIFAAVQDRLTALEHASSNEINNAIYRGTEPVRYDNVDFYNSSLSFAKALLDYSNTLQDDVQIRTVGDIQGVGYGIWIKSGHYIGNWTLLSPADLNIPVYVASDSTRNTDIKYVHIQSDLDSSAISSNTVVDWIDSRLTFPGIATESKVVVDIENTENIDAIFQFVWSDGQVAKSPTIRLSQNGFAANLFEHKSSFFDLRSANIILHESDDPILTSLHINVNRSDQTQSSNRFLDFPKFVDSFNEHIRNVFLTQREKLNSYATATESDRPQWFKIDAQYKINIKPKLLFFGTVAINKNVDTSSEQLRIDTCVLDFDIQIIAVTNS